MPSASLDAAIQSVESTLKQAEALVAALSSTHRLLRAAAQDATATRTPEVPHDIAARLSALEQQLAAAPPTAAPAAAEQSAAATSTVVAVEPVTSTMLGRPAAAPRPQGTYEVPSLEALPAVAAAVGATVADEAADATASDTSADEHIDFESLNALTAAFDDDVSAEQADEEPPQPEHQRREPTPALAFPADSGPTLI